jgi:hypothetical protein
VKEEWRAEGRRLDSRMLALSRGLCAMRHTVQAIGVLVPPGVGRGVVEAQGCRTCAGPELSRLRPELLCGLGSGDCAVCPLSPLLQPEGQYSVRHCSADDDETSCFILCTIIPPADALTRTAHGPHDTYSSGVVGRERRRPGVVHCADCDAPDPPGGPVRGLLWPHCRSGRWCVVGWCRAGGDAYSR